MQRGFTLIELLIVVGLITLSAILILPTFSRSKPINSIESSVNILVNDIKEQQLNAMLGETQGVGVNSYGIYFQQSGYSTFQGVTYSTNNQSNFDVTLPDDVLITNIAFPQSQLIFSRHSGDVLNFVNGQNTIQIKSKNTSDLKTITVNKHGVLQVQ